MNPSRPMEITIGPAESKMRLSESSASVGGSLTEPLREGTWATRTIAVAPAAMTRYQSYAGPPATRAAMAPAEAMSTTQLTAAPTAKLLLRRLPWEDDSVTAVCSPLGPSGIHLLYTAHRAAK